MVLINYATKEIVAKIVYYGPGLCGKTTNLQQIYAKLNPKKRGKMIALATEADRTLFFDFLPVELGVVQGFKVRFQLYTVPGQVFYSATRRLVLKGADAVVFVADSQADVVSKNIESIDDMKQNLLENDLDPLSIPVVFQYNKRDLDNVVDIWLLEKKLNYRQAPYFEATAIDGTGVMETFKEVTNLLIRDLKRKHSMMNTDTIRELPPDVFEPKEEKPAEEVPLEAVLELGSSIREEGSETDVPAGSLLGAIETISLADSVQAEAFFDNVRKGAPTEEARQKAERVVAAGARSRHEEPEKGIPAERELTPDELEFVEEAEYAEETADGPAGFLGLDPTAPEMMEPGGVVSEGEDLLDEVVPEAEGAGSAEYITPAGPVVGGGPAAVAQVDLGPVLERLERLEAEISALGREVAETRAQGSRAKADGVLERLSEIEKKVGAAADGQDRLLLSILEAVRDSKKGNVDAQSRVEDALKYIAERLGGVVKEKKRWF